MSANPRKDQHVAMGEAEAVMTAHRRDARDVSVFSTVCHRRVAERTWHSGRSAWSRSSPELTLSYRFCVRTTLQLGAPPPQSSLRRGIPRTRSRPQCANRIPGRCGSSRRQRSQEQAATSVTSCCAACSPFVRRISPSSRSGHCFGRRRTLILWLWNFYAIGVADCAGWPVTTYTPRVSTCSASIEALCSASRLSPCVD